MTVYAGLYNELNLVNRRPTAGSVVYVYERGTTTPATLYTSRAKAGSAPNPVTVDASANLVFYAEPGSYTLARGSETLEIVVGNDPAETFGSVVASALAVDPEFTDRYQRKMMVDVRDYGAVGDGVTNDSAAFAAAVADLPIGATLWVPPDFDFRIINVVWNRPVNIAGSWAQALNSSPHGSVIRPTSDTAQDGAFVLKVTTSNIKVDGLAFAGHGIEDGGQGLVIQGTAITRAHENLVSNCTVYGFEDGLVHGAYSDHTKVVDCLIVTNVHNITVEASNMHDLMHTRVDAAGCANGTGDSAGETGASVFLELNATTANFRMIDCHLGFGPWGILQDTASTSGGFAGMKLTNTPIESVSVGGIKCFTAGNWEIDGSGYWLWSGTPTVNGFVIVNQVSYGDIDIHTRFEVATPNANAAAVVHVIDYTQFEVRVRSKLNAFALARYGGNWKSGRTRSGDSYSPVDAKWVPGALDQWYCNPLTTAIRNTVGTLDQLMMHLFYSGPDGVLIDQLDINIQAVSAGAGAVCRMGVWTVTDQARPFRWVAGVAYADLLHDAGTKSTEAAAGTGSEPVTGLAIVVDPNTWFCVGGADQVATPANRWRAGASAQLSYSPWGNSSASGYAQSSGLCLYRNTVTGAFPATFTPNGITSIDDGVGMRRDA